MGMGRERGRTLHDLHSCRQKRNNFQTSQGTRPHELFEPAPVFAMLLWDAPKIGCLQVQILLFQELDASEKNIVEMKVGCLFDMIVMVLCQSMTVEVVPRYLVSNLCVGVCVRLSSFSEAYWSRRTT